ncbi:hypothetical protein LCGC14_2224390, partial [marine sediment metagenome]
VRYKRYFGKGNETQEKKEGELNDHT